LNRIKEVLDEKNLTQVQLGEMIKKSFESVNAYCSNRRQPSVELLYEISTALSCPVKDLLIDNNDLKKK
jgi:putative transcriptional regulator